MAGIFVKPFVDFQYYGKWLCFSGQLQHLPEHAAGQAGEGQAPGGDPRPVRRLLSRPAARVFL